MNPVSVEWIPNLAMLELVTTEPCHGSSHCLPLLYGADDHIDQSVNQDALESSSTAEQED